MKSFTKFLRQHSLAAGVLLMFLFTWPIDLSNAQVLPFQIPFLVYIFLGYGVSVAALVMTALMSGTDGVIRLLKRFLIWRLNWKWYLVALLFIPLLSLMGVVLNAFFTHSTVDFSTVLAFQFLGPSANLLFAFFFFVLFDAVTNGEELGWRGYVLPRLQAKHGALVSSLILGVVWSLWHLPRFLAPGSTASFPLTLADTMTKAIFLTWLYNNSGGSLLLVTLAHAGWNGAAYVLPTANTLSGSNMGASIIAVGLQLIAVIVITAWYGPERLARAKPRQIADDASLRAPAPALIQPDAANTTA